VKPVIIYQRKVGSTQPVCVCCLQPREPKSFPICGKCLKKQRRSR
jgi:hypothetical protein